MTLPSQQTPGPDHLHPAQHSGWRGLLNNLAFRTAIQGIGIDVLIAVCLVVYQATATETVDWRLLLLVVAKTAVQTLVSSIMRRVRPPAGLQP